MDVQAWQERFRRTANTVYYGTGRGTQMLHQDPVVTWFNGRVFRTSGVSRDSPLAFLNRNLAQKQPVVQSQYYVDVKMRRSRIR